VQVLANRISVLLLVLGSFERLLGGSAICPPEFFLLAQEPITLGSVCIPHFNQFYRARIIVQKLRKSRINICRNLRTEFLSPEFVSLRSL
jgi:hypothetical protein